MILGSLGLEKAHSYFRKAKNKSLIVGVSTKWSISLAAVFKVLLYL